MARQHRLLLVKDAAMMLGVSPNTIRNWGRNGKLPEFRHPMNQYRLFREVDLLRIRRKLEQIQQSRPA
jgi:DNA (cytosine-5)-methyltransferase 1